MKPEAKIVEAQVANKLFTIETGKIALQAGGAVTLRVGDTIVFAAATMSPDAKEGYDFFPLTVEYEERMYAGGRIPGSFFRREGRPTDEAILTARLSDRPLRPLFPADLRNEVQVIMYSLSSDGENPIDILAVNAASAALSISDIPWNGPIGAVRIGRIDGEFIVNPTFPELEYSDLDLRIAGTRDAILMVECGANEITEEDMVSALEFGHQALQPLIEMQERLIEIAGKPKASYTPSIERDDIVEQIRQKASPIIHEALDKPYVKSERNATFRKLEQDLIEEFCKDGEIKEADVRSALEKVYKQIIRSNILERKIRADGRNLDEIRPIWCEVDVSPRAHGSGLFTRGETQVLTLATLGTPREAQEIDSLSPSESKRYMHHYNFPPFSTGETKMLRGASRREIGHGALAERALLPVIPPESKFPYTLRLVSEVLSSNGSSSMASVCGSTLALMDTGVPILAPVAGVAMGLVKEGDTYAILTDILGLEDHYGDMDFKVAGTPNGITALQMDIKIKGITSQIMSEALEKARIARGFILEKMLEVIPEPRPELKSHAPRITVVQIPIDKIGAVIGPGGKTIRSIQDETKTKIDIGEDGSVFISATDGDSARMAVERVENLTETPVIGRIYTGKVVRVADFGAFVEILPNIDGLVHISQLDSTRINNVEDVVRVGDEITVMVTDIDSQGKIRLSRTAVLEGWSAEEAQSRDRKGAPSRQNSSSRPSGNRRDDRRSGGSNFSPRR
ncbi:MAG: polyribonucleotide nucleotidyltransferase [Anaerolineales bacterium]